MSELLRSTKPLPFIQDSQVEGGLIAALRHEGFTGDMLDLQVDNRPIPDYILDDFCYDADAVEEDNIITLELLPHQIELMEDTTSKILGTTAGFGSGKTFIVARKTIQLASLNPGTDLIVCEPNFPLLVQILLPELHAALKQFGLSYTYKATEQTFFVDFEEMDGDGNIVIKTNRLICKSLENYDRLIGINASGIILDEFDTAKTELAYNAFLKLLGRLRAGTVRQLVIVSTPEGFKAMYRIFITEKRGKLIKAKTTDNVFLPDDFVQTLYDIYPENLVQAYINGEFVNLKSTTVFNHFDRKAHHATITITDEDRSVWLGGDFNAGGCITLEAIYQQGVLYVFGEMVNSDTFGTRDALNVKYAGRHLYGSFDATGAKRTSNASQSDLDILAEAGVSLMMGQSNPHMMDSILSVNAALKKGQLKIDTNKCPRLTEAMEQLAYDDVTGNPEKVSGPATIDDFTDALRYLVWALMPVSKVTFSSFNAVGKQKTS